MLARHGLSVLLLVALVVASSALMALGGVRAGAQASAAAPLAPRIPYRGSTQESLNWAGYVDVFNKAGIVRSVNASWIVPSVSCSKQTTDVAVWVGIDGYNDNTVEQTGILVQCQAGKAYYYAWYEFYPASPVYAPSSDVVKPGDKMVGWVVYNPSTGEFRTVLVDVTEHWNYTSPWTSVSGAEDDSAEWIVERPAVGGSLTQLADFGKAYFNALYTGILPAGGVYVVLTNGSSGNISSFNYVELIMVNNKGSILAQPSPLASDGASFYVCYGSCTSSSSSPHHSK